ncbi:hypothetical protein D0A34_06220 [Microcoleus vaginatus PCC 9802]|nr:hypothetical protein MicvaDRAFT_5301 [Microcoleus vaginatus FGP-2]UNU18522.1 hypothetical protein D0A34_06220 [Microcoleus vaginatus PCC 9802]
MKLVVWSLSTVAFFFQTGTTKKAIALTGIKLVRSPYYESAIYLSDWARNFDAFSWILLQNFTGRWVKISRNRFSLPDISFFIAPQRAQRAQRKRRE